MDTHDFSLQVENFKNQVTDMVNSCGFPPIVLYYVMKDINQEVEKSYFQYLNRVSKEEAAAAAHAQQEASEEKPLEGEVVEN